MGQKNKYSKGKLLLEYINASNKLGRWVAWNHDSFIIAGIQAPISSAYSKIFGNAGELRRLAIKEYGHLINFKCEKINLRSHRLDKDKFIELYIKNSIQCGYKMLLKDIALKLDISQVSIHDNLGRIKDIQREASIRSKEFDRLPTKIEYIKRISLSEIYIQACLKNKKVIGIDYEILLKYGVPLPSKSMYSVFKTTKEFREYCASISPEFAELLANSKFAKK